jgi:hypothetical protein
MKNDPTALDFGYMKNPASTPEKLIFWNFKNYWNDILEIIKARFGEDLRNFIHIKKWEKVDYSTFSSVIDHNGNLVDSLYPKNILHVFIAPITWAGLYTGHFTILGPAFATFGDIKLYNIVDKNKANIPNKLTIGVIDKLATSTIGLQIIMRGICKQVGKGRCLSSPICEDMWDIRLQNLKNNHYTAAVFNEEDIGHIHEHHKSENINDIVDIDELYALAKRIPNLPRVVYAISKRQFEDESVKNYKTDLINVLKKINININNRVRKKHVLAPFDEENRNAILDFLKDGKQGIPDLEQYDPTIIKNNFFNLKATG